ncbi:DUF3866 family protein [Actinospica sp.]|uniref:DUF3866 family protein n=1 Tax=Actinospica sp. TaxID=1872142 RepID=UPI002B88758D|nr:DUF3866 family protein [Actinospica sp.]HWG28167.1 DUF3866 family protein [Actinospica sp.]
MIAWREGHVTALGRSWPGARELTARVDDADLRVLAYPQLVGEPRVGDRILLNVNAQAMGLGTGGYALAVALPDRLPQDPPPGPGHLVKARYTPLQPIVLGADEQDSAHHDLMKDADSLDGMPVVSADLHSAVPAICAAIRHDRPATRIAYVMSDGGALPLWFSRTVAGLREAEWLCGSVTVGQAFGGDLEAVTVHTGLLAAKLILGAEVAIVSQGPGNLGTGTKWGFSGVACGEAVNAAGVLGGRAIGVLRVSEADARDRHRGLSHHSLTAYGRVALAPAELALPDEPGAFWDGVRAQAATLDGRHTLRTVPCTGLDEALAASPVALSTMGRGLKEDRAGFLAAACAGRLAVTTAA